MGDAACIFRRGHSLPRRIKDIWEICLNAGFPRRVGAASRRVLDAVRAAHEAGKRRLTQKSDKKSMGVKIAQTLAHGTAFDTIFASGSRMLGRISCSCSHSGELAGIELC